MGTDIVREWRLRVPSGDPNLATRRVEGIAPPVTGERNHVGHAGFRAPVDLGPGARENLLVVLRVVQPLGEDRIGHAVHRDGVFQPIFLDRRPQFRWHKFDAPASQPAGGLTNTIDVPLPLRCVQAPVGERLLDAAVFHDEYYRANL